MSRHITTVDPQHRKLNNTSDKGKLILTKLKGKPMSLLLRDNTLIAAQVINLNEAEQLGDVYIGKVSHVVKNMDACFVEIGSGKAVYLPFKDGDAAFIRNRKDACLPLKAGDELPVQIHRTAIKTKPAAVTTRLELATDYFVFKAGDVGINVSNKIDKTRKAQIRQLLNREWECLEATAFDAFMAVSCGIIARTKCSELCDEDILLRFRQQAKAFCDLFHKATYGSCYTKIYAGASPVISSVQQVPAAEYDEIITDIPEFYEELTSYYATDAGIMNTSLTASIRLYEDSTISLAKLYGLLTKLDNACQPRVWLKSGASLVIEQTECLTTIDINSSKNIKGRESAESIFRINLEAAEEAALQIRLRNLSGIIIADFINMQDKESEEELLTFLRRHTESDPVPTKVVDMTPLGLVEITRKKVQMSLKEQLKG